MVVETQVAEEHATRQDHGSRVGLILTLNIKTDVTASGLKDCNFTSHVAARDNTGTTDQGSTNVGENTTVQVGHDHDVKLLRAGDGLHGGVVDNHIVDLEGRVLLGNLMEGVAEEAVSELHDVGLVDASDLGAAVGEGKGKSKLGDALRLGAGDNFEGLNNAGDTLVLKTRVLTLGVLTDDTQVNILVAGLVAGNVLDQADAGVDVELLAHGYVEALVAGAADGSVKDTLEAELVATERGDTLTESVLSALTTILNTSDIDLLPLNGDVVGLEDGLDGLGNLGTDTVSGDEGDGVLAAVLGRLENVGLDGSEGSSGDLGLGDRSQGLKGNTG